VPGVRADDEGTPAEDVVMIDRGRLRQFMHSRETAARLGLAPTGNARAYGPHDEPLVRMRNTVILPGDSTLDDDRRRRRRLPAACDTSNGQADTTTEFMFGVSWATRSAAASSVGPYATPRCRATR
jgi:TldD protein